MENVIKRMHWKGQFVINGDPSITEEISQKKISELLNIAANLSSIMKMKHGKRKNHSAALTLRWEARMALKSVNLLEFIFYHSFQIFYHKNALAYTGMMV